MSAHAYTEDRLVEQPAIGLFAELGWATVSALEEQLGGNMGGEDRPFSGEGQSLLPSSPTVWLGRETKANTLGWQIMVCTVNQASRVHFSEKQRARRADGDHDFLFGPPKWQLIGYDPARHGAWEIGEADDESLVGRPVGEPAEAPVDDRDCHRRGSCPGRLGLGVVRRQCSAQDGAEEMGLAYLTG